MAEINKKRILFIDDNKFLAREIDVSVPFFSKGKVKVDTCSNFNSAVNLFHSKKYDLVISDIVIKGEDNFNVVDLFKIILGKGVPLLINTAGTWKAPPEIKIKGFGIIKNLPEELSELLNNLVVGKIEKPVSAHKYVKKELIELEKYIRPQYHITSPLDKNILLLETKLDNHITTREEKEYLHLLLEERVLSKMVSNIKQGNHSKKEINKIMDRYLETKEILSKVHQNMNSGLIRNKLVKKKAIKPKPIPRKRLL